MKKIEKFVGIDVGKLGAIASYDITTDILEVVTIPILIEDFRNYMVQLRLKNTNILVCIEQVSMWSSDFGNAGKSFRIGKMMKRYNEATSILRLYEFPHVTVTPGEWQNYLNLSLNEDEKYYQRKSRLYDAAKDWFPNHYFNREQADSVLIMRFLMKKYEFDQEWIVRKIPKSVYKKMI